MKEYMITAGKITTKVFPFIDIWLRKFEIE